jgi:flagellar L-ring protein precursor FlgH
MKNKILPLIFAASLASPLLAPAQSLWVENVSKPMFVDKRANSIGDILTIVVQESSSANKSDETKTEKQSSWVASVSQFIFPGFLQYKGNSPAVNYQSDLKHDGSGAINNSQTIVAQVAVKVIDVLPNKSLVIEGKRDTSFGGEHQTIILHGIVRSEDVTAANTVLSYNIADATISIVGEGSVTDSTKKGWFTRIVGKLNPF